MAQKEYRWSGTITDADEGLTLYDFFRKRLKWSRRFLRRLRETGCVLNNHSKVPYLNVTVRSGDTLEVIWQEESGRRDDFDESAMQVVPPLDLIHVDDDLVVVNKPVGFLVHPVKFQRGDTIQEALIARFGGEMMRPVHRLDRETSGVLVFARHALAHQQLADQFKKKTVRKVYFAIAFGWSEQNQMEVNLPIDVDPEQKSWRVTTSFSENAQEAFTVFYVMGKGHWRDQPVTLFRVEPHTGRTHQIRVHAAAIGQPLIGDFVYGGSSCRELAESICLHAHSIELKHPRTRDIQKWQIEMPQDWKTSLVIAEEEV